MGPGQAVDAPHRRTAPLMHGSHCAGRQRGEGAASCLFLQLCCFAFQMQGHGLQSNSKTKAGIYFLCFVKWPVWIFMIQLIFVGFLLGATIQ